MLCAYVSKITLYVLQVVECMFDGAKCRLVDNVIINFNGVDFIDESQRQVK